MKRWPLLASFALFIALCVSAAYWAMQLFRPAARPVAAPPQAVQMAASLEAARSLFGGRQAVAVSSNFQLRGVIVAGNSADSVAILAAGGKPSHAVKTNTEVIPGVRVSEVHSGYVLLAEGGEVKRVDLQKARKALEKNNATSN